MNEVQEIITSFKGQPFSLEQLAVAVQQRHPEKYAKQTWTAWKNWCRGEARKSESGDLPFAASVDGHGTYRQLAFWGPEEYRIVIRGHMKQSGDSRRRAYQLADECERVHGVVIDPIAELSA